MTAAPVPVAVVVVVPVVVSFVVVPVLFVRGVVVLVAVVFPEVLVHVPGVASFSGLHVAVSGVVAVLVPVELFHIDAVLSLSPFLSHSPARLLRISFFCCCSCAMLALSLSPTCVVSLFPELVPRFLRTSYEFYWFCCCCCLILLYLWCLCLYKVWAAVDLL